MFLNVTLCYSRYYPWPVSMHLFVSVTCQCMTGFCDLQFFVTFVCLHDYFQIVVMFCVTSCFNAFTYFIQLYLCMLLTVHICTVSVGLIISELRVLRLRTEAISFSD